MPADVAGHVEVHEYKSSDEEDIDGQVLKDEEIETVRRRKKNQSKSIKEKPRWRKKEDVMLS